MLLIAYYVILNNIFEIYRCLNRKKIRHKSLIGINHTFTPENVSGFGCRCGCKHPHPHPHPITQKNWVFEFQNDFEMKKNTNFELKKNFRKIQKFR